MGFSRASQAASWAQMSSTEDPAAGGQCHPLPWAQPGKAPRCAARPALRSRETSPQSHPSEASTRRGCGNPSRRLLAVFPSPSGCQLGRALLHAGESSSRPCASARLGATGVQPVLTSFVFSSESFRFSQGLSSCAGGEKLL